MRQFTGLDDKLNGLGAYEGEAALAIGAFHYVSNDVLLKAAVSHTNDAGTTARAGVTWGF